MAYDYFYGKQPEQYQFYKLPKLLIKEEAFKNVSMDAKILYSMMLDRASLSAENGWLDENGRVYIIYTVREICKDIRCGLEKAVKLLKELENDCGLIRRKKQKLCKPDLIYVMNFATDLWNQESLCTAVSKTETPVFRKPEHRDFENQNTRISEIETPEFRESKPNKTDNNKTEENDTDLILSDQMRSDTMIDLHSNGMSGREKYRRYFQDQLNVTALLERYPYEEKRIKEIIELLTDVCSGDAESVFVGKTKRSGPVVRSRLMKLENEHICYILHSLDENHTDVKNIRQYLLTALYNAPTTMTNYYQAKVNHDMASGAIREEGDYYR